MVWDTFASTSKALSALIDCNSFLPEGKQHYSRQTAGESSFPARQTSRQFHIRWCATRGCQADKITGCKCTLKTNISSFQMREMLLSLCTLICIYVHIAYLFDTLDLVLMVHKPSCPKVTWSWLLTNTHGVDCRGFRDEQLMSQMRDTRCDRWAVLINVWGELILGQIWRLHHSAKERVDLLL